ncbi:hypothetical protein GNI_078550 [Gregarina niphandrodes]|uniref:Uncharacterized protein n=1 Tax=Gregarina niphandrodes TaxID=110365 RepID=A0A023B6K8_GRENI|nr:hypothetical protein GNI_078550 [Gregarina niphandrodes]EZG66607.1 hypothetical protein GNI_078550 [Gregarina niphandrodes]|eukprot:XP_011130572.1 hypothetical protein GNI_078550 [Gregarina niphandrodes]
MAPASVDILALLNATERAAVGRGAQSVTTTNPNPREAETDSEKSDQKEKEASSSASSSAEPSTEPRFELINDPVDEQPPKEGRIRKFVRKTPSPILRNVSTTGFRNVRVDANSRARVLTEEDKKQLGKNNQLSWNLVSRPIPPAQD